MAVYSRGQKKNRLSLISFYTNLLTNGHIKIELFNLVQSVGNYARTYIIYIHRRFILFMYITFLFINVITASLYIFAILL